MAKDVTSKTQEVVEGLLELMGIKADFKITLEDDGVLIDISTDEDAGLLIGRKGETLGAIQTFIAMALRQDQGEWVRVTVNIGDWREKQEEHLKHLADQAAQRAIETGDPQYLYNLNSTQRRIVHMALAENKNTETFSEGEGSERYLVVKSAGKK